MTQQRGIPRLSAVLWRVAKAPSVHAEIALRLLPGIPKSRSPSLENQAPISIFAASFRLVSASVAEISLNLGADRGMINAMEQFI